MDLVWFDLDEALLTAGGIGRHSTRKALEVVYGTAVILDELYSGGRTKEVIFADTLADSGIDGPAYQAKRDELYTKFLEDFKEKVGQGEHQIHQLPGANQLIII